MAWKYNPFTDALDQTGSGGASYIDGVVADPTALPVTLGTPALDSVYLAKAGSGVWLINRRPSGLYVRVANNGNLNDWLALGAFPEVNSSTNWELYDGTDPTKELKFNLSGISTGNTRTLTVPDSNGTIARTEDFAAPPSIGSTTANTGAFTTLSATGTTELVNGGTTAGPFRVYNASTSANANFERGFVQWTSNNFEIGCEAAGTGTLRNVRIKTDATSGVSGQGYIEFGGSNIINSIKSVGGTAGGALYIFSQSTLRMLIGGSSGIGIYQTIIPLTSLSQDVGTTTLRWRDVFCRSVDLTGNIILPTATGTKIGTGTTQLLGFWNATPATQPAAVADATDAASTQARLNDLLARLRTIGIIAT